MKVHAALMPPYARLLIPRVVDQLVLLNEAAGKPDEVKKWRAERARYPFVAPPAREGK